MAFKPDKSIFKNAESLRSSLTKEHQKKIEKLYADWAKDIEKRASKFSNKTNPSATLSQAQANILKKQIEATGKQVANGVYTEVENGMLEVSEAVLGDAGKFMKDMGFPEDGISAAFSNVPAGIVNSLVTGSVYGKPGSWSLSKSIWSDNEGTMQKAYEIVAKGIAENLPVQDIAGMLKDFVDPSRQVPWVGPKGNRIYSKKVDYNAQRLVRTLSQHTYQQSMVATAKDNPFIESFRWVSNGSRACELCKERDGKVFKKDEVPLDHPNGMCVMEPVADVDAMTSRLADWAKGKDDPDVDKFAKRFGYEKPKTMSLDDIKKKYGNSTYKQYGWWKKSLPKDVQDEVQAIVNKSGMNWNEWYKKHIMKGAAKDTASDGASNAKKVASTVAKKVDAPKPVAKVVDDVVDDLASTSDILVKEFVEDFDNWITKYKYKYDITEKLDAFIAKYVLKDMKEQAYDDLFDLLELHGMLPNDIVMGHSDSIGPADLADIVKKFFGFKKTFGGNKSTAKAVSTVKKTVKKKASTTVNNVSASIDTSDAPKWTSKASIDTSDVSKWASQMSEQSGKIMSKYFQMLEDEAMKVIKKAKLSGDEIDMIEHYTGAGYKQINEWLRSGVADSDVLDERTIDTLKSLIDKLNKKEARTTEDMLLRRGTDVGDLVGLFMDGNFAECKNKLREMTAKELNDMFKGSVGEYKSFTSTSSHYDFGFSGEVEVILYAPKGTAGLSVTEMSNYGREEGEFLLNAGTKVICEGIERAKTGHKNSVITVYLRILV